MLTDKQRAAGWIEHDGGGCPVRGDILIRAIVRDHGGCFEPRGRIDQTLPRAARDWHWRIDQTKIGAIIAYRPES